MTPTDDQLREAARRLAPWMFEGGDWYSGIYVIGIEPNGTIWRTPRMAYVTATIAVPISEAGEVEG